MDLTFITSTRPFLASIVDNIIAMSWPGSFFDSMWRNNIHDVEGFLNRNYKGNYWVYRLAKIDFTLESISVLKAATLRPPFHPSAIALRITRSAITTLVRSVAKFPSFLHPTDQIKTIVEQCRELFNRNPLSVVAIHCKVIFPSSSHVQGGKGRTGMIVSCLLLKMSVCVMAQDALLYFAQRRTTKKTGFSIKEQRVSSPSQIRYVFYYRHLLENDIPSSRPLSLKAIAVHVPAEKPNKL